MRNSGGNRPSRRAFIKTASAAGAALAAGGGAAAAATATGGKRVCSWFNDTKRMLHLDAHFSGFPDIYRDFDADRAAGIYADAGFQLVSYFAKCWGGYSYYPTKIGIVHPSCNADYTGRMTEALKKRGLKRIVYFMMMTERALHREHPEWVNHNDPASWAPETIKKNEVAVMCYNSPYVDKIAIPQMKEIIGKYDIDGFFIDIVIQQYLEWNCFCPCCRDLYAKEMGGEIPRSDADPKAFAYRKWSNRHMEQLMEHVYREVASVKPDVAIIFNYTWMFTYPVTPPAFIPYLTWDTPTPNVGNYSYNFSLETRYLNTLPDVPFSCMNTQGNNWGEYNLRETEAFQQECATLLAGCGGNYLSDIPYPSGNPAQAIYSEFRKVNDRYKTLEPLLAGSKPVREVAVLHNPDSIWSKSPLRPKPSWNYTPPYHSVAGAHKALVELHVETGIVNSDVCVETLKDYRALILSDQRILSDGETAKIREFVKNGGALLVTHETGTRDGANNKLPEFMLADMLGVRYIEGVADAGNCYLRATPEMGKFGVPMMDVEAGGGYTRVALAGAKKLADLVPPYRKAKAGPPDDVPDGPGVTVNTYGSGKVVYCAADIFGGYYRKGTPNMRKLARWMLDLAYPENTRLIALENAPVTVELFLNERGAERFVHLINYSADKRDTGTPQVQDMPSVHGMKVRLRMEKKPSAVTLVPDGTVVPFKWSGGWLAFDARPLKIHDVYRIG